jgi:DNA repair exonuclease SbcCD ATPase subunit
MATRGGDKMSDYTNDDAMFDIDTISRASRVGNDGVCARQRLAAYIEHLEAEVERLEAEVGAHLRGAKWIYQQERIERLTDIISKFDQRTANEESLMRVRAEFSEIEARADAAEARLEAAEKERDWLAGMCACLEWDVHPVVMKPRLPAEFAQAAKEATR